MIRRTLLACVVASALVLVLGIAGCATSTLHHSPSVPKTPRTACLGVGGQTSSMWLTTADGRFDVGLTGTGATTAILVHQLDASECGWFPYATELAARGVRVLLLNLCGSLETTCSGGSLTGTGADAVLAAADWARIHGAGRVVAVGASIGGTTVMIAATHDAGRGRLDAVADLSSPVTADGSDIRLGAPEITIPTFLAVDPADSVVSVLDMRTIAGSVRSPDVTLIDDANGHGWDMLNGPGGPTKMAVGDQLTDFILG